MISSNSQERTIYRSLAEKIQLGFYNNGERFPSAQEIAHQYEVSYCPAQRALKMLEKEGLIQLCRGKETVVLAKPYNNYLQSNTFKQRITMLTDLNKSLRLISPEVCFHGLPYVPPEIFPVNLSENETWDYYGRLLYQIFGQTLKALGSQTVLSLYYDIGSYAGSSFLDIFSTQYDDDEIAVLLHDILNALLKGLHNYKSSSEIPSKELHRDLNTAFFQKIHEYMASVKNNQILPQQSFAWEPHKGRTRYCDVIAIDIICKINQGIYPVGTLLPNGAILADTYHVSAITIRRAISIVNKLGAAKTINGVGTRVMISGDKQVPDKLKDLMLDDNLKTFLEALQLLSITCESVIEYSFPYFSEDVLNSISQAAAIRDEKNSMIAVLSCSLQAVVHQCPLAAVREIYSRITLMLLKGNILRVKETSYEQVPEWPGISNNIINSCTTRNSLQFSKAFSCLVINNFIQTKKILLDIGVKGIEGIVTPKFLN